VVFHIYGIMGKSVHERASHSDDRRYSRFLYRKLKQQAAAQGRSIRELILLGVRVTLIEGKRPRSKRVKFPLIASEGPKVDLTNEQIYEHIEFP